MGGGVRSLDRARALVDAGASKIIVGTAAFSGNGINEELLTELIGGVGRDRIVLALDSKGGKIVVKGWRQATELTAVEVIHQLEPYCGGFLCTYVDKEGMLEGTDLAWYRALRHSTSHELTAAGGITAVEEIEELNRLRHPCGAGHGDLHGQAGLG